jgi:hypothetical protein
MTSPSYVPTSPVDLTSPVVPLHLRDYSPTPPIYDSIPTSPVVPTSPSYSPTDPSQNANASGGNGADANYEICRIDPTGAMATEGPMEIEEPEHADFLKEASAVIAAVRETMKGDNKDAKKCAERFLVATKRYQGINRTNAEINKKTIREKKKTEYTLMVTNTELKKRKHEWTQLNKIMTQLNNENRDLKYEATKAKTALALNQAETDATRVEIRKAANKFRYAELYGVDSSRGETFCPVTQQRLLPPERVLMFESPCECNCIITYKHAEHYLRQAADGTFVKCLKCRETVTKLVPTTAGEAESLFTWNKLRDLTGADDDSGLAEQRNSDIDKEIESKTARDTAPFRALVEGVKSLAAAAPRA